MPNDQNAGGWPDAARPGVPMNPEQDGWHWVRHANLVPVPRFWRTDPANYWEAVGYSSATPLRPAEAVKAWIAYLGPDLTPAEVQAREAAAAAAMREAAAEALEAEADHYTEWSAGELRDGGAAAIRALPLPASAQAALDALLAQAREDGAKAEREAIAAWHSNNARLLRDPTMQSLPTMPGPIICRDRAQIHEDSAAAIRARGAA